MDSTQSQGLAKPVEPSPRPDRLPAKPLIYLPEFNGGTASPAPTSGKQQPARAGRHAPAAMGRPMRRRAVAMMNRCRWDPPGVSIGPTYPSKCPAGIGQSILADGNRLLCMGLFSIFSLRWVFACNFVQFVLSLFSIHPVTGADFDPSRTPDERRWTWSVPGVQGLRGGCSASDRETNEADGTAKWCDWRLKGWRQVAWWPSFPSARLDWTARTRN